MITKTKSDRRTNYMMGKTYVEKKSWSSGKCRIQDVSGTTNPLSKRLYNRRKVRKKERKKGGKKRLLLYISQD